MLVSYISLPIGLSLCWFVLILVVGGESTNQDEPRRTKTNQNEPRRTKNEPRQTKNELTQTKPLGSELTLKQIILRKNTMCYTVYF